MRFALTLLGLGVTLFTSTDGRAQDGKKSPPPAKPDVYYAVYADLKDRVRLSDEMAAKIVEIIGRKSKPFQRTLRVAPRGYFVIDGKTYAYYSFLASDPEKGDSWEDPALTKFWKELNRVEDNLSLLKDFKP